MVIKRTSDRKMSQIKTVLKQFDFDRDKFISREWQKFGYDLAQALSDMKNKSLYMKLAKTIPRAMLMDALAFVKEANNVKSPARLFMWKLGQLNEKNNK